jgi:hypothetical protein
MGLILVSPVFEPNGPIPQRYTGDGEDLSPPLHIGNISSDTVELALIVEDPDAPQPEPWIHWVVYRIPADTQGLPEGIEAIERPREAPLIEQGQNSWGTIGYRGPAPPRGHGVHHYHFRLFALRDSPDVRGPLGSDDLRRAMQGLILEEVDLVGTYERHK